MGQRAVFWDTRNFSRMKKYYMNREIFGKKANFCQNFQLTDLRIGSLSLIGETKIPHWPNSSCFFLIDVLIKNITFYKS